jgi:succinate-semialdehyde dehydrogenase/glutarate-semialdehyde dehydrogenase
MKLKDSSLLRESCFIDGGWAAADNGGTLPVHNPATAEKIGLIPNMARAPPRNVPRRCAAGST